MLQEAAMAIGSGGARLPPMPTIRDLIKLYKLSAIKQLSQNFIMDSRITDKIVRVAGNIEPRDVVLEVGAGPGNITRSIIKKFPHKLVLVEKDRRFLPSLGLLKECMQDHGTQIHIYQDDILKFLIDEKVSDAEQRLHLIGNLPFAISTRLLINWLHDVSLRRYAFRRSDTRMTLTFQQEVAERICAPPCHMRRCRLSVMSQIWTRPELKFSIPGKAFVPKPDVDVGVVRLIPLRTPKTYVDFKLVEKVVRHIFSMRQKYSRRGFATLFPEEIRDEATHELFKSVNINPEARPFQLSVEECLALSSAYQDFILKHPEYASYDYRGPKGKTVRISENIEDYYLD